MGTPLCGDCYDYPGHVLWQWEAPELWRRFRIALDRTLAHTVGADEKTWRRHARLSYSKVGEFQARGLIHFHAIVRLDGPDGPESPPLVELDADALGAAVLEAADRTAYRVWLPALDIDGPGEERVIRFGSPQGQHVRPIRPGAGRDDTAGAVHPEMVAGYAAKYLVKSTEDFGLTVRVFSARDALMLGASEHVVRIIQAAEQLAATGAERFDSIANRYGTLGFRGHVLTKSRRYSTTFRQLREARVTYRTGRPRPPQVEDVRVGQVPADLDPDSEAATVIVAERSWAYAGSGYLDLDSAERALNAACHAREHAARIAAP